MIEQSRKYNYIVKKNLFKLLLLIFLLYHSSFANPYFQKLAKTELVTDSVITDLSKVNWTEVEKMSSKQGELLAELKDGDRIMISRKAYLKHAWENNMIGDTDKVFTKMEISPEYPGGEKAWLAYLQKNLHYSQEALNKKAKGTVLLQFRVDMEGNISEVSILKPGSDGMNEEAIRLVKESGKWNPGIQNFRVVRALVILPITFKRNGSLISI